MSSYSLQDQWLQISRTDLDAWARSLSGSASTAAPFCFGKMGENHCSGFQPLRGPLAPALLRGPRRTAFHGLAALTRLLPRFPLRNTCARPAHVAFGGVCKIVAVVKGVSSVAFGGVCAIVAVNQTPCSESSPHLSQTPPVATWAQAEWRWRGVGERGRDAEPAPMDQGRSFGAARWSVAGMRGPRRGQVRSNGFGYFPRKESDAP